MKVFTISEVATTLKMPETKLKNWTVGRPLEIVPSLSAGKGKGSRNIFSREDVYLIGLLYEFSKAGFAAKAIGKLLEVIQSDFPNGLAGVDWLTVWRHSKPASKRAKAQDDDEPAGFEIRRGKVQPPDDRLVWMTVNVGRLLTRIDGTINRP